MLMGAQAQMHVVMPTRTGNRDRGAGARLGMLAVRAREETLCAPAVSATIHGRLVAKRSRPTDEELIVGLSRAHQAGGSVPAPVEVVSKLLA